MFNQEIKCTLKPTRDWSVDMKLSKCVSILVIYSYVLLGVVQSGMY